MGLDLAPEGGQQPGSRNLDGGITPLVLPAGLIDSRNCPEPGSPAGAGEPRSFGREHRELVSTADQAGHQALEGALDAATAA